ncbi:MAG: serine/threonine-protein kinase [Myxococcota bacterium]
MGVVWLACDELAELPVAIKVLGPQHLTDDGAHARFEREARRLAMFHHPNVVRMIDAGTHRGHPYIAMEFVDGVPLHLFLRHRERLDFETFLPIAGQICAAVAAAHARNIMIRDIKPANILVCEHEGRANFVKLLDFGLAKRVINDTIEVTRAEIVGTTPYVAPEMICGKAYDTRVDVYALGVLFFVMLTGSHPIVGSNEIEFFHNHLYREPLAFEQVLPPGVTIPPPLRDLIRRCLHKDPDHRPRDAREVAHVLFESFPDRLFELPRATTNKRRALKAMLRTRSLDANDSVPDPDADTQRQWTRTIRTRFSTVAPIVAPMHEQAAVSPTLALAQPAVPAPVGYGFSATLTRAIDRSRFLWRMLALSVGLIGGLEVWVAARLFLDSNDVMASTQPRATMVHAAGECSDFDPNHPARHPAHHPARHPAHLDELQSIEPAGVSVHSDEESAAVHATPIAGSSSRSRTRSRPSGARSGARAVKHRAKRSSSKASWVEPTRPSASKSKPKPKPKPKSKTKSSAKRSAVVRSATLLPTKPESTSSGRPGSGASVFLPTSRNASAAHP